MTDEIDAQEVERRSRVAEWLQGERERYEYLLQCAAAAEREELAWETIVARMTVEDFVTAAKEVLAAREILALVAMVPRHEPTHRWACSICKLHQAFDKHPALKSAAPSADTGTSSITTN